MFDLEQAIAQWRRQLAAGALTAPEVLDELESHLRDDIEAEVQSGSDIGAAFAGAVQRIGPAGFLQCEFDKIGPTKKTGERVKHAIFTFAGIPNQYSSTLMNTSNSVIEPSWATYLKAAVFLVPVLSLWAFSTVFLLPKVQTICRDAGIALPVFFRIIFAVISTLREQGIIIVSTIVVTLVFLEWRSGKWPRYRRTSIGLGVFLVNSAILVLITAMFTLALMAAPALFHTK
jgi:hypothetical protein